MYKKICLLILSFFILKLLSVSAGNYPVIVEIYNRKGSGSLATVKAYYLKDTDGMKAGRIYDFGLSDADHLVVGNKETVSLPTRDYQIAVGIYTGFTLKCWYFVPTAPWGGKIVIGTGGLAYSLPIASSGIKKVAYKRYTKSIHYPCPYLPLK